jgi:hypothetical protein
MDLFEIVELRRQTAMHTNDFLIDDSANRHHIEAVRECFPQFKIVLSFALIEFNCTFVVEAVDTVDAGALVIASQ